MADTSIPFAGLPLRRALPRSTAWGGKALLVFALALLMAIPGLFVWALIADRANRAEGVVREVSALQGGAQQVLGPLLVAPYTQTTVVPVEAPRRGQPTTATSVVGGWYVVSPATGEARLDVVADERRRGLFPVPVYTASVELDAVFGPPPGPEALPAGAVVDWSRAQVIVGVSDLRGVRIDPVAAVDIGGAQARVPFAPLGELGLGGPGLPPGVVTTSGGDSGFGYVGAPAGELAVTGGRVRTVLKFTGAQRIGVLPFARSTRVSAIGVKGDPKFDGGFLPERRTVTDDRFEAAWTIPFVARGLADHGTSASLSLAALGQRDLGISFVQENSPYKTVMRALKYAVMFVGLVFLTFFVFEALSGQRLHPAQYLLIGLAQMVFYLLLLSLSEYIGFDPAFAVAAVATVGLIGLYAGAAFRSRPRALQALGVFSGLYALIYLLMRLEDFALLAGSLASFLGLAAVMWLTRNIDWYGGRNDDPAPAGERM